MGILLAIAILLQNNAGRPTTPGGPTLAEVKAKLLERESAFHNLTCVCKYVYTSKLNEFAGARSGEDTFRLVLDNANNVRLEWSSNNQEMKTIVSIDEKEYRSLRFTKTSENPELVASGRRRPRSGVPLVVHPATLLNLNSWALLNYLERATVGLGKNTQVDGVKVVELNCEAADPPPLESARKGTFWLAPDFGYSVIRSEESRRPKASLRWRPIVQVECDGFRKYDQVWLPNTVRYMQHSYYEDGSYEPLRSITATFVQFLLNRPLDVTAFHVGFPAGTRVRDDIKGGPLYISKEVTDMSIANQVQKVLEHSGDLDVSSQLALRKPRRSKFFQGTTQGFLGLAIIGLSIPTITIWIRWRNMRKLKTK